MVRSSTWFRIRSVMALHVSMMYRAVLRKFLYPRQCASDRVVMIVGE